MEIPEHIVNADFEGSPSGGAIVYLLGALLFLGGMALMVAFPEVAAWLNSAGLWTLREVLGGAL